MLIKSVDDPKLKSGITFIESTYRNTVVAQEEEINLARMV